MPPATARQFVVQRGDCREVLATLETASIDAIVTDPPYELGFMGKAWDKSGIAYDAAVWRECLRVLKPGGHLIAFGGSRTYHRLACAVEDAGFEVRDQVLWLYGSGFPKSLDVSKAIDLARKPLIGTVAENVLAYGTGGINVDGCRIAANDGYTENAVTQGVNTAKTSYAPASVRRTFNPSQAGRWPANLIHDGSESVTAIFPGEDDDSAARFFYCAKASKADREYGLPSNAPVMDAAAMVDREVDSDGMQSPRAGAGRTSGSRNHHPTVKPIALMRHLVRLITPPGGVVLDPFAGSGSTGVAARLEGMRFLGIEQAEEYAAIAEARIAGTVPDTPEHTPQMRLFA